jgi:hypothetical protein
MAFKFTYSFAIVVALSSRVALGHLVKCNGVTAPSGNFDDFFTCTNSLPPSYAPLTETLSNFATPNACEAACSTRGHGACSFSVYDAGAQTCAIYHSPTAPGPVVDVVAGGSNTVFLNTICDPTLYCDQVLSYVYHDYLIKCSAAPQNVNLGTCVFANHGNVVPPSAGVFNLVSK